MLAREPNWHKKLAITQLILLESSARAFARFGDLDSLLALSIPRRELRTLVRVLAGGGEEGRASLLHLCSRFQAAADGGESRTGGGNQGASTDGLLESLPAWEVYQFLVRSFLSLHMLGDAGSFPFPSPPPPSPLMPISA